MEKEGTEVDEITFERFGIEVKSADYTIQNLMSQPLGDWGITKTGLDSLTSENNLKGSVLFEIKDYKNITQPKQRFEDDRSQEVDEDELARISQKNFSSYLMSISDGMRDAKLLILQDMSQLEFFRTPIRPDSKY
mmetsp:Transcript_25383/g.25114  ORF Transcript_25383/g.25114 Transcript_25383/m.25114 type:complete len:135 (+) Transcript_25383:26-430(+)